MMTAFFKFFVFKLLVILLSPLMLLIGTILTFKVMLGIGKHQLAKLDAPAP